MKKPDFKSSCNKDNLSFWLVPSQVFCWSNGSYFKIQVENMYHDKLNIIIKYSNFNKHCYEVQFFLYMYQAKDFNEEVNL